MRNSIFWVILLNVCSLSIVLAVYMCYRSIVATQTDIKKGITSIKELVQKEITFELTPEALKFDVENYCDMVSTCAKPLI